MNLDPLSWPSYIRCKLPWRRTTVAAIFLLHNVYGAEVFGMKWTYRQGRPHLDFYEWNCKGCLAAEPAEGSTEYFTDSETIRSRAEAHAATCRALPPETDR